MTKKPTSEKAPNWRPTVIITDSKSNGKETLSQEIDQVFGSKNHLTVHLDDIVQARITHIADLLGLTEQQVCAVAIEGAAADFYHLRKDDPAKGMSS